MNIAVKNKYEGKTLRQLGKRQTFQNGIHKMNIQIQRLTFLLRIWVVSGSNLGMNTVHPQVFRIFLSLYRTAPG